MCFYQKLNWDLPNYFHKFMHTVNWDTKSYREQSLKLRSLTTAFPSQQQLKTDTKGKRRRENNLELSKKSSACIEIFPYERRLESLKELRHLSQLWIHLSVRMMFDPSPTRFFSLLFFLLLGYLERRKVRDFVPQFVKMKTRSGSVQKQAQLYWADLFHANPAFIFS